MQDVQYQDEAQGEGPSDQFLETCLRRHCQSNRWLGHRRKYDTLFNTCIWTCLYATCILSDHT